MNTKSIKLTDEQIIDLIFERQIVIADDFEGSVGTCLREPCSAVTEWAAVDGNRAANIKVALRREIFSRSVET